MAASEPTVTLSENSHALPHLARILGRLTSVTVVPVSNTELSPVSSLQSSPAITNSEFGRKAESFDPLLPNQ